MGELYLPDDAEWKVICGQIRIFPEAAIAACALSLSRSLDCHVPTKECEVAAVEFVRALKACGWTLCPPSGDPQS